MLRDITLGQYYPADSVIHKLDPRVKLFATLIFIISLFSFKNVWGFLVATIFMFGFIELSKVPIGYMVKGLKAIVILMIITALFNLFLTSGKEKSKLAVVASIGADVKDAGYACGDKVLYKEYSGTTMQLDDEEFIVIKDEDIIAVSK